MKNKPALSLNTCQIPTVIFDYWMFRLTDAQFKVLMTIAFKTCDCYEIQQMTGFVEKTVKSAVSDLIDFRLVNEISVDTYQLNTLEQKEDLPKTKPCIPKKENKNRFHLKRDQKPIFEEIKALKLDIDDREIVLKIREAFKNGKVHSLKQAIAKIQGGTAKTMRKELTSIE